MRKISISINSIMTYILSGEYQMRLINAEVEIIDAEKEQKLAIRNETTRRKCAMLHQSDIIVA